MIYLWKSLPFSFLGIFCFAIGIVLKDELISNIGAGLVLLSIIKAGLFYFQQKFLRKKK